jgi:hypothetical protein
VGKRSCSSKTLERDDDSKKSHPALSGATFEPHEQSGFGQRRREPGRQWLNDRRRPVVNPDSRCLGKLQDLEIAIDHAERNQRFAHRQGCRRNGSRRQGTEKRLGVMSEAN